MTKLEYKFLKEFKSYLKLNMKYYLGGKTYVKVSIIEKIIHEIAFKENSRFTTFSSGLIKQADDSKIIIYGDNGDIEVDITTLSRKTKLKYIL